MSNYKLKRFFVWTLIVALYFGIAEAKPVSVQKAARVATTFWNSHRDNNVKIIEDSMKPLETDFDAFYIFTNGSEAGFVIVSADDCVFPILAYSFYNFFKLDGNDNARYWLSGYQEQIDFCRRHNTSSQVDVSAEWERLNSMANTDTPTPLTSVSPLLTTTWDQDPYYNNLCPYSSTYGQRTVTGCVATAMAQVMKYWEHPTTGTGSHSYPTARYGMLSANFENTTYDWQNMPTALTSTSTVTQKNAVATLMYHCGVAIEMDYGVASQGGSGAYLTDWGYPDLPCTQHALVDYFKYSDSLRSKHRNYYSDIQWRTYIKNDLDASRPVLYAGHDDEGGHCFVCDGYNSTETHFHFNWGWGGYCDGYYTLANLAPGAGGIGGNATYTFNQSQQILIGVKPVSGSEDGGNIETECEIVIGDTINIYESVNIPVNNRYKYSLTEMIVLHDELCDSMTIGELFLYYNYSQPSTAKDSVTIWIQPTTKSSFTSTSDIELLDSSSAIQVYHGPLNCTEGWNRIPFRTIYQHNNLHNVMIIVDDNSNGYDGSGYKFRTTDANGYKTLSWFDNVHNPSPLDTAFYGQKYIYSYRPLMKLSSHRAILHTITVVADNSEHGVVTGGGTYEHGEVATITATANEGFHFLRWSDGSTSNPRHLTVTDDALFTAIFAANIVTYNVVVWSNNPSMGTVSGGGQYPSGATAILSAIPYNGCRFVQWNDSVTNATRSVIVTGNATYSASFEAIDTYCITVLTNDSTWGTVSGGGTYYDGNTATLIANPKYGYRFVSWDDGNTERVRTVTVHGDTTYMAWFTPDTSHYFVTVLSGNLTMGSVDGGGAYHFGDTVTITAMANAGYRFIRWQDGNENCMRDVVVTSDTLFIASFEPVVVETFTIVVVANNSTMGVVIGSGDYRDSSTVTIRAVAFEGYEFIEWHDGETRNPRQITVTADSTFVAIFQTQQGIETVASSRITVYPNPTSDFVYIYTPDKILEINVMTITGRSLLTRTMSDKIDLAGLTHGEYLLKVMTSEGIGLFKIILR